MIAALIVLHVFSIIHAANLPFWMARDDERLIRLNGPRNTLRGVFHRQRLLIRASLVALGALPWALNGWHSGSQWAWAGVAAYFLLAGAWFLRTFNPQLNLQREPPKATWYVSLSEHASRFDQFFINMARAQMSGGATELAIQRRAGIILESVTRWLLYATLLTAGPLWIFAFLRTL